MTTAHDPKKDPEKEWSGPLWKHPAMLYIFATILLFLALAGVGWFAYVANLIPRR